KQLDNFRQELADGGGLSSYPHPWLMPDFWQFPTVSMGLGPIGSIYQARFNRYLKARGFIKGEESKVWCFVGDGESDEPESLGSITLGSRENLDNLVWVINCNLQRLDGPVRGNGKIIQELEALFRGAGWNVIKVIWGSDWDDLLARDTTGLLLKRMEEAVDGDYQKYTVEPGSYIRKHFFGKYPELLPLVNHLTDEQLHKLMRGGHDTRKVYAAYKAAVEHKDSPTVILAKTIKGYGMGEAGEGRNISHNQKKMNEKELREFRERFKVPIGDDEIAEMPFYRPAPDSAETKYLLERRKKLGGFLPKRIVNAPPLNVPKLEFFAELLAVWRLGGCAVPVDGRLTRVELERLDRMKNHFLGMVSHEFKTPLTSIISGAQFLLAADDSRLPAEARQVLDMVLGGGLRLHEILNDLLKVARLEAKS
ncbi:MAG: histidine kinase dimerization/phospho-acceptor domain-containing protein, partial [Elusimicrobiota bacterium]